MSLDDQLKDEAIHPFVYSKGVNAGLAKTLKISQTAGWTDRCRIGDVGSLPAPQLQTPERLPHMGLFRRHGDHGHEEEHGHGDGNEDSARQHAFASLFWYVLAAVLVLGLGRRLVLAFIARQRIKRRDDALSSSSLLDGLLQSSQGVLSGSILTVQRPAWLTNLPLKKAIIIIVYTLFVTFLVTWKSIRHDEKFYERIGFRAAWITTTQTSLPFLLAARANPIGLILGTSYERINWLHRWASRVFVATATVHGGFFVTEWLKADFFWTELKTVGMVKYGLAAWIVLVWTLISSLIPIRRMGYEFFVFQHIFSVVCLLGFLILHVPKHHLFSIWCAVAVYAYDVVMRSANPLWRNIRLRLPSRVLGRVSRFAHEASVTAVDGDLTVITIQNVPFSWTPGQHVLIWISRFGKQSPHPFTISSIPSTDPSSQEICLTLKTKTGFTKKLNEWARHAGTEGSLRLLLAGPYGVVPNWRQYDGLVLISTFTGGSFITPILEDLLSSQSPGCIRRVSALYIAPRRTHLEPYLQRISQVISRGRELGISVRVQVAVTQGGYPQTNLDEERPGDESHDRLIGQEPQAKARGDSIELERFSLDSDKSLDSEGNDRLLKEETDMGSNDSSFITETKGRPDVVTFMRTAVANVPGNIAVAVCGGRPVEHLVKTTVASLRRERASEGLGAEVMLHIERSDI